MDTKKLKHIWSGGCHDVYVDAAGERVIKVPNSIMRVLLWDASLHAKNVELAKRYFGEYLLDTSIREDGRYGYVETREYIDHMRYLRTSDLQDSHISEQFSEILDRNKRLYKEVGASLDIFGLDGILFAMCQDPKRWEKYSRMLRLRIAGYRLLTRLLCMNAIIKPHEEESFGNIIIDHSGKLKITDSTLTNIHTDHSLYLLFSYIVNHGNTIAMKRALGTTLF